MVRPLAKLNAGGVLVLGLLFGCRTFVDATETKGVESKSVQCSPGVAFKGTCLVAEVTGRQGVTTDAARASFVGDISELRMVVPIQARESYTEVQFFKKTGLVEELNIQQALDLYSRQGCLAEVNGGVFGEGFTPKLTLRILMNMADDARTGYAEVSDFRTGKTVHATLALKCDWQK